MSRIRTSSLSRNAPGPDGPSAPGVWSDEQVRGMADLVHAGRVAALGELSATISHELNQPLTAILANAQAARQLSARGDVAEVNEALADICDSAMRAAEIIRRLRGLLQKGEVSRHPLQINELIRSILPIIEADAREHDVDLGIELPSGLPDVAGDAIQLQQVLLNLATNACQAMLGVERRSRTLRLHSSHDARQGVVVVSVCDSGPAISEDVFRRLFEPFFTTKSQGLGIGLSISRSIVEWHGGRLWATRNDGPGVTMRFSLPALKSSGQRPRRRGRAAGPSGTKVQ